MKIFTRLISLLSFLILIPLFSSSALATSVSISNVPANIADQSYSLNVSVTGAASGTNYLRADLFPTGTTNYFGYTYNGSSFYNGSSYSQYLPITIDSSGNWSGTITAQIDNSSNYYTGPGNYSLKVRRYTQSGSSYTWSNEVTLTINAPTSTPTPTSITTPSPTPTNSSSNTATPTQIPSQFTFTTDISSITTSDSLNITVYISGLTPYSQYYLKGAFLKDGSSNYFGQTKVNGSWIKNNSSYSSQYPITTDGNGSWTGVLEIMPDSSDSGYIGSDSYVFKIGRYNSSGSGPTWSNQITLNINGFVTGTTSSTNPTTTPTPINIIAPNFTPISIKLASDLTDSSSSSENKIPDDLTASSSSVAGIAINPSNTPKILAQKQINAPALIGGALLFIISGALLYIRQKV